MSNNVFRYLSEDTVNVRNQISGNIWPFDSLYRSINEVCWFSDAVYLGAFKSAIITIVSIEIAKQYFNSRKQFEKP